jgi:hypothetical protein
VFIDGTVACDVCLNLLNHDFVSFLTGSGISIISAGFNKTMPDLKPGLPYFAFFMAFYGKESCPTGIFCAI